jgi:hypothetical protein
MHCLEIAICLDPWSRLSFLNGRVEYSEFLSPNSGVSETNIISSLVDYFYLLHLNSIMEAYHNNGKRKLNPPILKYAEN